MTDFGFTSAPVIINGIEYTRFSMTRTVYTTALIQAGINRQIVALKMPVNADQRFFTVVNFTQSITYTNADYAIIQSTDFNRMRFKDDEPHTGPSPVGDLIIFNEFKANDGDKITIQYSEARMPRPIMALIPKLWDYNTGTTYQPISFNNWPTTPGEAVSAVVLPIFQLSGGSQIVAQQMYDVWDRYTEGKPSYLRVYYDDLHGNVGFAHYLIPNTLFDMNQDKNYNYEYSNLRIECYTMPRRSTKVSEALKAMFTRPSYLGYWTQNPLRVARLLVTNTTRRSRTVVYRFKVRNTLTNEVSDWLPLTITKKNSFRAAKSVGFAGDKYSIFHIRFRVERP